ncbi:MAG: DUF3857 domain-containing transglutaminase family protein [Bacteroidales bacterium]|nr:DUF3857 domain-containing transglutaminase family protein [Bacteroidales bacterium]
MKKISFTICLLLFFICIRAAKYDYPVSQIDSALLVKANAVVRLDKSEIVINDDDSYVQTIRQVVTIMNRKAEGFGKYYVPYDKDSKVLEIHGKIFNAKSELINRLEAKDIKDYSAISSNDLYSDNRVKSFELMHNQYPYTILVEYKVRYNNAIDFSNWYFYFGDNVSVEKSEIEVKISSRVGLRYNEHNLTNGVKITNEQNYGVYKWCEENMQAFEGEPFMPDRREVMPWLQLSPRNITYKSFNRNVKQWSDLAEFIRFLNNGRDELEPVTVEFVKKLTADCINDYQKVEKLYNFLQENTRYVSIQLGIGGYQPFEANVVDDVKYGDCKALSNYMYAMLKAIGIKSYYALIKAGKGNEYLIEDFPSLQFNHAVLTVPLENDTLWLECTSKEGSMGYCGKWTGNRQALVITENGGELWNTPDYPMKVNTQHCNATVSLLADGNGTCKIETEYRGLQYENNDLNFYVHYNHDEQQKWLYKKIDIPGFTINKFSFVNKEAEIPSAIEKLDLQLKNYASIAGNRLFFKVNLMNRLSYVPRELEERKTDMVIKMTYEDCDTITYILPEGYKVEYPPSNENITSEFGEYSSEIKLEENKLIYIRSYKSFRGRWPSGKYNDYRDFKTKVVKADKAQVVLVKK